MQEPAVPPVIPFGIRGKAKKIIIKLCSLEPKQADALLTHFLERRDAPVIQHYHRDTIGDGVSYETINLAHLVFSDVCNLEHRIVKEKEEEGDFLSNDLKIIENCETSAELDRVLKDIKDRRQNEQKNPEIERAARSLANGGHYDLKPLLDNEKYRHVSVEKEVAKSIARIWMLDPKLQIIWKDQSLYGGNCSSTVNFDYTKTARRIQDNITKKRVAMAKAKAALKEKFDSKKWLAQWRVDHPNEWSSERDRTLVTAIESWSDSSFFANGSHRKVEDFHGFQIARFVRAERFKLIRWGVEAKVKFDDQDFDRIFTECSSMKDDVIQLARKSLDLFLKTRLQKIIREQMENWAAIVQTSCFRMNFSSLIERMPLSELPSLKFSNYVVVGVDPGWRNSCRTVILDAYGDLYIEKGYRLFPKEPRPMAEFRIKENSLRSKMPVDLPRLCQFFPNDDLLAFWAEMCKLPSDFKIVFVVGNGRYSRDTRWAVAEFIRGNSFGTSRDVYFCVVDEYGATRYSETTSAREELHMIDGVFRGAVSIARRAISPTSEYLKISPQHIGLGEYQGNMSEKEIEKLKEARKLAMEAHVESRGLDVNTASKELLMTVLDKDQEPMADRIIIERSTKSNALDIEDLQEVLPNAPAKLLEAFERHYRLISEGTEKQTTLMLQKEPDPLEKLEPGEIVCGIVRNVTDFATFIDIDDSISAFYYDPQFGALQQPNLEPKIVFENDEQIVYDEPKILNIGVRVMAQIEEVDGEKVSVRLKKLEFPDHAFNQRATMRLDGHNQADKFRL